MLTYLYPYHLLFSKITFKLVNNSENKNILEGNLKVIFLQSLLFRFETKYQEFLLKVESFYTKLTNQYLYSCKKQIALFKTIIWTELFTKIIKTITLFYLDFFSTENLFTNIWKKNCTYVSLTFYKKFISNKLKNPTFIMFCQKMFLIKKHLHLFSNKIYYKYRRYCWTNNWYKTISKIKKQTTKLNQLILNEWLKTSGLYIKLPWYFSSYAKKVAYIFFLQNKFTFFVEKEWDKKAIKILFDFFFKTDFQFYNIFQQQFVLEKFNIRSLIILKKKQLVKKVYASLLK